MNKAISLAVATAALSIASASPAHALLTRVWVASTGTDTAGCGPIQTPCRSLQYAHDQTAAGGEIDVKDSAGYGSVTITKAITIVGDGSLAGVLASSGNNAITINAGSSDLVVLRGLTIEGAGVGTNGVRFNSGGNLDIANCVIQNFVQNGIDLSPTTGSHAISVTNTAVSHNGSTGLLSEPQGTASMIFVIDRVVAMGNYSGVTFTAYSGSSATTIGAVTNSIASKNNVDGFSFAVGQFDVDLCHADENGILGFNVNSTAVLTIGRSVGASNGKYGLYNDRGTVSSFKDNRFNGNGTSGAYGTIGTATLF